MRQPTCSIPDGHVTNTTKARTRRLFTHSGCRAQCRTEPQAMSTHETPFLICDTREQRPFTPYFDAPCIRRALATGDYSLCGFEGLAAVERKSLNDLVQCCVPPNRERFERELARAKSYQFFAVICEGSYNDLLAGKYHSRIKPASVFGSVTSWTVRHQVPFYFAGSIPIAAQLTESLLIKFFREWIDAP